MNTITNTTFKSSLISIGLHACVVILGSLAIYQTPIQLELTGAGGKGVISLSNVSFINRKATTAGRTSVFTSEKNKTQTVSTKAAAVSSAVNGGGSMAGSSSAASSEVASSGGGNGSGSGVGNGHDFDEGRLFSQIKTFFEGRLGSTLNINVEQLIKIKVTLTRDGEILSADLIQGKLDFQSLKKVLNVAKNIPLRTFWKSTSPFPQELVIPLILTPS